MKKTTSPEKKQKKKLHIGTQLRLLYLTTMLLPLLIIGTALLVTTYSNQTQYYGKLLSSYNSGVRQTMYDLTTYIYNVSDSICFNDNLSKLLSGDYENKTQFMTAYNNTTIVDPYVAKYTGIGEITIYSESDSVWTYGRIVKVDDTIKNSEWYQKANGRFTAFWTSLEYKDNYNNSVTALTLIRKMVVVETGESAVVMIKVSNAFLNSRIESMGYQTLMTVNQEPVFFGTNPDAMKTYIDENVGIEYDRARYGNDLTTHYKGQKALASVASIKPSKSADTQVYIVSYDLNAYKNIYKMQGLSLLLLAFVATLPIIIIARFTHSFTSEIKALRDDMYKASHKGEKQTSNRRKKDYSSAELSEAYNDLMLMADNIEKMEAQQYEAEIKERQIQNDQQKMEFKVLASQINPHFLYNTLEMIRMKALTNNDRDVATAIKLLGQSMRYVLENTGTTESTLQKELDHVMNYLQIQKLRFGDRIDYQVNIQPDMILDEYRCLPLIMQPIVENSVVHGLEKREENGKIWVAIYTNEGKALVDLSDNAGGMDDETMNMVLHHVEHYETERKTSGIALYNINRRIKLNYGDEYGIEIHTVPGEGTRVRLILPIL